MSFHINNIKYSTNCPAFSILGFHGNKIPILLLKVEVEVTLRLTVSQSVCLGIEYPCGTCDQILFPVGMLLSEICGLVSIGRPL
jgi:hypothetical protein